MRQKSHARAPGWLLLGLLLSVVLALPAAPARAATIVVAINSPSCSDGPTSSVFCHIQPAIDGAIAGDTIQVADGIYPEALRIGKDVAIVGAGAAATVVEGGVEIAFATANVQIRGITIRSAAFSGVENRGTLTLASAVITGNGRSAASGSTAGGGILNLAGARLDLLDSVVSDNVASGGGGIDNVGTMTILRSIVSGNRAGAPVGNGAGIVNSGSLTITSSTISNNTALAQGGAIWTIGSLSVQNSTISGNRAASGAALRIDGQTTTLDSVTLSHNDASARAGGAEIVGGALRMISSIVAGNRAPNSPDCLGALVSLGANLVGDSSGCAFTAAAGDQVGSAASPIDPLLGGLKLNGGITPTMAPLPGSPAIDAIALGTGSCLGSASSDQRGVGRPIGPGCEVGAYESSGSPARLAFVRQPQGGQAGAALLAQPVLGVQDTQGYGIGYAGPITLTLSGGAPGARLSGPTIVNAQRGRADFSGLAIDLAGSGYQLGASGFSLAPAQSAPFTVAAPAVSGLPDEREPNNTVDQANPFALDSDLVAGYRGRIGAPGDIDLFRFVAGAGAEARIALSGLPNDYDMLLLADPRATLPLSDSIDLDSVADIGQEIPDIGQEIPDIGTGVPDAGDILARSAHPGADDESIHAFLPNAGSYFVLVFARAGASDTRAYTLTLSLLPSGLTPPGVRAAPVDSLGLQPSQSVRTIYLYHSQRMAERYPGEPAERQRLVNLLQPGSALLAADPAIGKGEGAAIDLASQAVLGSAAGTLQTLYNLWDAQPNNPLLANEAAQQVFYVLDRALASYYPGATDIVLVGGDSIIPFYRVPDETQYANEQRYGASLGAGGALRDGSALAGSLFFRYIQTDGFYADRAPTPWRGRALFLPDLGIGRLVERPSEIVRYLAGYLAGGRYTIDAGASSKAFVTGYDFLTDQAYALRQQLAAYGYSPSRVATLIDNTWGLARFANLWFGGQLGQLGENYSQIATPYDLTSLNGHFNHYSAIPASLNSPVFAATRIYTPTAASEAGAFFRRNGAPTLLYSIGCHSGLSADDADFSVPPLAADFPQAVLKQGGNWIGNTGYGYGDYNVIGYSERLALLFTRAVGTNPSLSGGEYQGMPIGHALARAKRQYLKTSGGNSFSVYDEKVLQALTLYGLPFVRVRVPSPIPLAEDDPPPAPIPDSIRAALALPGSDGRFTRVITLTNEFAPIDASGLISVTSAMSDSFGHSEQRTSTQQTAIGKPVLPLLSFDLTLARNPSPLKPGGADGIPIARGVQLLSAISLPELGGFRPRVTTTITDQISLTPPPNPLIGLRGAWLPGVPYSAQRSAYQASATQVITSDRLLVYPAQFNATGGDTGRLRRFAIMVFEISYVDPRSAPAAVRLADSPPDLGDVRMALLPVAAGIAPTVNGDPTVRLSAAVRPGVIPLEQLGATYTIDGRRWQRAPLTLDPQSGRYELVLTVPFRGFIAANSLYAFVQARNRAGQVAVSSGKGTQFTLHQVFMIPLGGE